MTYQDVLPFLVQAEPEGSKMYCAFQAPGSDQIIEAEASIRRIQSLQSNITRAVKRNASRELRRTASRMLRSALGSGFLGRTASNVVRTSTRNTEWSKGYSNEEKEAAIVAAFEKVSHLLTAPQDSQPASSSISISTKKTPAAVSEFEEQLQKFPIRDAYDQEIFARMLAELATIDGSMAEEESEFLNSILPPELGSIDAFLNREPLSPVEAEEVSSKAKVSMYMVAWALSLIDLDLNRDETQLLEEFGQMLGLSDKQQAEAQKKARAFVLEGHIDTETSRDELYQLADKLAMSHDDALRAQIQLKKRQ